MWPRSMTLLMCFAFMVAAQSQDPVYSIAFQTPEECLQGGSDLYHEYYDMTTLQCEPCAQNSTYQTVASDGLSCVCRETCRRIDFKPSPAAALFYCEICPTNQEQSSDGYSCITCSTGLPPTTPPCPQCSQELDVTVERHLNGSWLTPQQTRQCVTCQNQTSPVAEAYRCERCSQTLSVQTPGQGCTCPTERQAGGLCFREASDLAPDSSELYTVYYEKDISVRSIFFEDNIRAAHGACVNQSAAAGSLRPYNEYGNLTACQFLANLCVMTLYSRRYDPPNSGYDACALHLRLTYDAGSPWPPQGSGSHPIAEWRDNMPWLFYDPDVTEDALTDRDIPTSFRPGMNLTLVAAKYNSEGGFINSTTLTPDELMLCRDTDRRLSPAFQFGVTFKKQCLINLENLFTDPDYATYFYDLYFQYESEQGVEKLQALPVLIRNYENNDGIRINEEEDSREWQLVRRFFKVDRVSGVRSDTNGEPELYIVRFARRMVLHVTLQAESNQGLIYPPFLEITYDQALSEEIVVNQTVRCSFEVVYHMDDTDFQLGVTISISVLSVMALMFAVLKTATWNKRSGKIALDFVSLLHFLMLTCGSLANAFFIVAFGFSVWNFIFYKGQEVFYLVLPERADYYVRAFIGSAFALKFIHVLYIIVQQVIVDIFLIDWERSPRSESNPVNPVSALNRATSVLSPGGPASTGGSKDSPGDGLTPDELVQHIEQERSQPVSAWRSFFIANEWLELQTVRRVNPMLQWMLVLLLLEGVGLKSLARYEPDGTMTTETNTDDYNGEYSLSFRMAVFGLAYVIVACSLRFIYWLIVARYRDNPLTTFIDLCSLTNVSVLVMTNTQFGYYIHGRSPHGHADVGMERLRINLLRERENLCGHRGLMPGEEQQTFEVALPRRVRLEYDRIVSQLNLLMAGGPQTPRAQTRITHQSARKLEARAILNRFFQCFLDHNLQVDYVIKNKTFTERILDSEFEDTTFKGIFYPDKGCSFEETLLCGHEMALHVLSMCTFILVDIVSYDFVLATIITAALETFISTSRKALGKRNVSKKTLVDDRFLI